MAKRRKQSNAILWVLIFILLVCFVAIGYVFYTYFYAGTSSTKYGNRLDDISNYPLPETLESDIKNLYKDETIISDVKYERQGRIIYIRLDLLHMEVFQSNHNIYAIQLIYDFVFENIDFVKLHNLK